MRIFIKSGAPAPAYKSVNIEYCFNQNSYNYYACGQKIYDVDRKYTMWTENREMPPVSENKRLMLLQIHLRPVKKIVWIENTSCGQKIHCVDRNCIFCPHDIRII